MRYRLYREIGDGPNQARKVNSVGREEVLILGRDESVDNEGRIFVIRELDSPFAGERLYGGTIITADIAGERRLIGEQRLRRRQAAREINPHRRKEGEEGRERPCDATDPSARPPGIDDPMHPLVEGDEIRHRPSGKVQALELHSAEASSRFGRDREVT